MTPEQIGEYLELRGSTDEEIDDFLAHFGVKGMQWGVRRTRTPAMARTDRAKGMGVNQLRSENKRIAAAGGGLRGTIRVRNEMIKNGELSKEKARAGTIRFGRNLAIGVLGGGALGLGLGAVSIKALKG